MDLVFLVFAFVLFCIAASLLVNEPNRLRVVSAGLAFWVAASIFGQGIKYFVK
jgi:hypothetical protein